MRRASALLAAGAVLALVLLLRGGGGEEPYRLAAVFDTAKGMVPGQVVKVAGARVGKVTAVRLAPGPAARMELEIDGERGPFRADASCRILPEGFISENYIDCDPGSAGEPPLRADAGGLPTVARARTSVPLALQDVLNVFSAPTPQRLQVLLSNLGMGLAGRGDDLNTLLRRANPSLTQARRALAVLGAENERLGEAVDATDEVLAQVARRRSDVRAFVGRTAEVARTTGARRDALRRTVGDLPATLRATRTALASLRDAGRELRPTLARVREAAPAVTELASDLPAFTTAARPALATLRRSATVGRPVVRRSRTTVKRLRGLTRAAADELPGLDDLLVSLRDTGGIEALMNVGYKLAAMSAAHDDVSHMAGVFIGIQPQCFAAPDADGCLHGYDAAGSGTIPINAPSAGPQTGWDTVMTDARVTAPARKAATRKLAPNAVRRLLEYLLR